MFIIIIIIVIIVIQWQREAGARARAGSGCARQTKWAKISFLISDILKKGNNK